MCLGKPRTIGTPNGCARLPRERMKLPHDTAAAAAGINTTIPLKIMTFGYADPSFSGNGEQAETRPCRVTRSRVHAARA